MASREFQKWEQEFDAKTPSSAYDCRSDTVTLPTGSMLTSILKDAGEFGDDVYSEDGPTNALEAYIADLTGMKHAVFVSSGTMGNQIALRCLLTQPPHSVICDRRSHMYEWECGMASMFSQAHMIPVMPDMEKSATLRLEDIVPNVMPDNGDLHSAPTRVISLENTFWGRITPVEEVDRICRYARKNDIKVHLDGARLWNACYPSTNSSLSSADRAKVAKTALREYCAEVDSVTMCFSKSLGAPDGSILLSNSASFIHKARHFRKALGGGMRQTGILSSAARVAVDEIFLSGEHLPRANAMAKQVENIWKGLGGHVQQGLDQETNVVWLDLRRAEITDERFARIAAEEGAKVLDGRIVTHHQIGQQGIDALDRTFRRILLPT